MILKIPLITCLSIAVLALIMIAPPAQAEPRLNMNADSCFAQMRPNGPYPIKITIVNHGSSVSGTLRVTPGGYGLQTRTYSYPIDLPSGSTKVINSFPSISQEAGSVSVAFDGSAKVDPVTIPLNSAFDSDSTIQAGLVGDDFGALGSLRRLDNTPASAGYQGATGFTDCYCKPEDAPAREAGYENLDVLVIAEGAERLTDAQWSAIRQWTLTGGCVVLTGGAGSLAYLNAASAAGLCPVTSLHETVDSTFGMAGVYSLDVPSPVALVSGAALPSVQSYIGTDGKPLFYLQRYGTGSVALVAFNPFLNPIMGTSQQGGLLKAIVSTAHVVDGGQQMANTDTMGYTYTPSVGWRSSQQGQQNPFQIQLPSVGIVAFVLIVYFVLAIPITFSVLRKRNKLEWAWATTPILSVLFAFIFYLFTASLYAAGLSHRTTGTLSLAIGQPEGVFKGSSDLFFPRGGSYELAVDNASSLEPSNQIGDMSASYEDSGASGPLDTVDTGTGITAPSYNVTNLAFRRIAYTQGVSLGGTITASIKESVAVDGLSSYTGTITNSTSMPLKSAHVGTCQLGDIAAGQTINVNAIATSAEAPEGNQTPQGYRLNRFGRPVNIDLSQPVLKLSANPSLLLVATTDAARFGPKSGRDVSNASSVTVYLHIPVARAKEGL